MKKLLIVAAMTLIFLSSSLYAQDNTGFYIGIGGNYALEDFDRSKANDDLALFRVDLDFDNSPGFKAKVGYHFSKLFSAEFAYDYFSDFSWSETSGIIGAPVKFKAEMEIMTFMISGKLSPDIGSVVVRPFITAGVGLMQGKLDLRASAPSIGYSDSVSDSDSDLCAKLGVGVDFYVTKNISIDTEVSYVAGFHDMDNFRYYNYNLGVSYHF